MTEFMKKQDKRQQRSSNWAEKLKAEALNRMVEENKILAYRNPVSFVE